MQYIGVNLYHWSNQEPIRWISEILVPASFDIGPPGVASCLWFTVFDARAPHVFAVYSLSEIIPRAGLDTFRRKLEDHLKHDPLPVELSLSEVEERHEACRGKKLCRADGKPGLARPNTVDVFEHSEDGYPFSVISKSSESDELWGRWLEASSWALHELVGGGNPQLAGLLWIAAVSQALSARPKVARAYWRVHVCSLLPTLADRLESEGEAAVIASLPLTIGEKNQEIFQSIWEMPEIEPIIKGYIGPTLDILFGEVAWSLGPFIRQLRELNHVVCQQLMLPVRSQIPLLLHAWWRSANQLAQAD